MSDLGRKAPPKSDFKARSVFNSFLPPFARFSMSTVVVSPDQRTCGTPSEEGMPACALHKSPRCQVAWKELIDDRWGLWSMLTVQL